MNTFQYKLLKNFGALKKGDIVAKRWAMDCGNPSYTNYYCKTINDSYDYKYELLKGLVEDNKEFFTPYAFTTEDNVDMFAGENYYYIDSANRIRIGVANSKSEATLPFSTQKGAENYLLLEEAKKRYPIGTRVKLIGLNAGGDFDNIVKFTRHLFGKKQLYVDGNLLLYDNGKWAEIAEDFEVGDYLILEDVSDMTIERGSLALVQKPHGNSKLVNVIFLHIPELGNIAYFPYRFRKATDKEIISHYEKQGWVNGAKFALNGEVKIVCDMGYNKSTKLVIVRPYSGGAYSVDKCTLIKKLELPKSWEDLTLIKGYYINNYADINKCEYTKTAKDSKNVFKTEKQAKSALAFAQLSQIVAEMNGDWTPDWNNSDEPKYSVDRYNNSLEKCIYSSSFKHLCFKTKKLRDFSLENHRTLWEQYWEI